MSYTRRTRITEGGPILVAGHHEPLVFRRRGGWVRDGAAEYRLEHGRDNAEALKTLGVNWVRVHYFKGFGLRAEAEELEMARDWISLLHRYGIRAETYLQFSNVMYETFLAERPEAMDWVQRTQEGTPNRLCYGHQAWRYLMCPRSPDWEAYLREVVRRAVTEAGADQIAWDNYDINITPDFCQCNRCRTAFRRHLEEVYPDPETRALRYGFTTFEHVEPPVYNRWNPVLDLMRVRDPLIQDWVVFSCRSKTEALGRLNDYGRSLRPGLTVNCNGIKGPAENLAFTRALDLAGMCEVTEVIGSEEHHTPGLRSDGALITNIRTRKRCAAFGSAAQVYVYAADPARRLPALGVAESAAFDLVPTARMDILERRSGDEKWRMWDFLRAHAELLGHRKATVARVAVLRGSAALRHGRLEPYYHVMRVEQALIESHSIFEIIQDEHLQDLGKYRLLILPATDCLGEREERRIRDYVSAGGGLLLLGDVGVYDEWRRPRAGPCFHDLEPAGASPGVPWRAKLGAGEVAWLPAVSGDAAAALDHAAGDLGLTEDCFTPPANQAQLLGALRSFGPGIREISVRAPRSVAVEWWEHEDGARTVHLVNYDVRARPRGIRVRLRLRPGERVRSVRQYAPELPAPQELRFRARDGVLTFRVPVLDLYCLIAY